MAIILEPHLIQLQSIPDSERGILGVAECDTHVPFKIERIFYQYDMPVNAQRGGHAHFEQEQFLIAMSGILKVQTRQDGNEWSFTLESPTEGLFIPAMTWLTLETFRVGSICLVLTSGKYVESDYIRDYGKFRAMF
jgi:hypothetical protein